MHTLVAEYEFRGGLVYLLDRSQAVTLPEFLGD
jgi:hypothetical protein